MQLKQNARQKRLLRKKFSKLASSVLVAKDGINQQSDGNKLNCWAKHFEK